MTKAILVTGATGKQGGSVVDALIACPQTSDFLILAVTRSASGASAQKLKAKADNVRLVEGNMDDVPALFKEAKNVAGMPIWGVYSVQVSMGKGVTLESEVKQGNDMIDESVKQDVKQFVYSSVDRGGDEVSWNVETPIEHFKSKYRIEHHLRDNAKSMGWTVLRPVAFMDNLNPDMQSRVFMTAMRDSLQGKPNQWIAVKDIGWFAAAAFQDAQKYNKKAMGLAGDELTFDQQLAVFDKTTSYTPTPTFWFLGAFLKYMVTELGLMLNWFGTDGYGVDIAALRKMNPELRTFEQWIKEDSPFPKK